MKLVNAGSVPRWAPATQSARCLCLTHYQFYCRCLCRNWKNSDSNPNARFQDSDAGWGMGGQTDLCLSLASALGKSWYLSEPHFVHP